MESTLIKTRITLYPANEGGRHCMPTGTGYSPYLKFDGEEEWLAVEFIDVPKTAKAGSEYMQVMRRLYPESTVSRMAQEGVRFEILEGAKVVGAGMII